MRFTKEFKKFLPIYKDFFWKYKFRIMLFVVLGFLLGFLEGISIGMLIPLFSFVIGEGKFGNDFISRMMGGFFEFLNIEPNIWLLLALFVLLFLITAGLDFLFGYGEHKVSMDYERKIMSNLYRKMLFSSWPFLLKQKIGHLEHILMVGVPNLTKLIKKVFVIIQTVTGFLMYALVAYNISPFITVITTFLGMVIIFLFKPLLRKKKIYMLNRANVNKEIAHDINENVGGIKTIKAMGVERQLSGRGVGFFKDIVDIATKQFIVSKVVGVFWKPFTLIFVSAVFVITYYFEKDAFDLATFVAVIYLIQRIFTHISGFYGVISNITMSLPYANMVVDVEREALRNREEQGGEDGFEFKDILEFKNISFSYNGDDEGALRNVSFKIKKGEMVGLVGRSGAGKTTLFDLVLRLFQLKDGFIFIDGKNINEIKLSEWRKNIGYVSQDVFLKNDTIENNIKFFDENISSEKMIEAAKTANIYDFIESLPEKFETVVGERGVLLSGGQRQRIILARALSRNPKILLLDEATSALDNESEFLVQNAIEKLKGDMTIIVIAHRLSTVMNSDRLFVIDKGRIIEHGSPKELLENKESQFYRMYNIRNHIS